MVLIIDFPNKIQTNMKRLRISVLKKSHDTNEKKIFYYILTVMLWLINKIIYRFNKNSLTFSQHFKMIKQFVI